jgi:hypothetical protein
MKTKPFLALTVALAGAIATFAQTPPAPVDLRDPKPTPAKSAAPGKDAKKDTKKDDKKKKEEMGKIDGMEIARGTGFLGLQIVNGVFKITSYNAKKKPAAADFSKITLRWTPQNVRTSEFTTLTPGGSVGVFSSDKIVRPPYSFHLFVTLVKGEEADAPVESLTVDFHQDA